MLITGLGNLHFCLILLLLALRGQPIALRSSCPVSWGFLQPGRQLGPDSGQAGPTHCLPGLNAQARTFGQAGGGWVGRSGEDLPELLGILTGNR